MSGTRPRTPAAGRRPSRAGAHIKTKTAPTKPPRAVPADAPTETVTPTSPAIIELDPNVTGGPLLDRFDVMFRARVVSVATIRSVTLIADGAARSTMGFGPEPAESTFTLPNGMVAQQRSVQFTFARPLDRARDPCPCRIVATDADGNTHEQTFELVIDPTASPPVRMVDAPLQPAGVVRESAPAMLYVERVIVDSHGQLLVEGWAVSQYPVMVVQVYAGEQRLIARTGIERGDVAQAYPSYPGSGTSGFHLTAALPEAARSIDSLRIEMMCRRGLTHEAVIPVHHGAPPDMAPPPPPAETQTPPPPPASGLTALGQSTSYVVTAGFQFRPEILANALAPPPPAPPPPEPDRDVHMYCDEAWIEWDGRLVVSGWATSAAGVVRVAVSVDDRHVGVAELGHDRPDVGEQHATIPGARFSGFRFDRIVADGFEGDHRVRVTVTTNLGDEHHDDHAATASARPTPPESPPASAEIIAEPDPAEMKFQLDSPQVTQGRATELVTNRLTIDGWVLSRSGIAEIAVWLDDQSLGQAHHGLARQDVGAAFSDWPNATRSGFAFHCPPRSLRNGARTIRLIVRCENGYSYERRFEIEVRRADTAQGTLGIQRKLARTGRVYLQGLAERLNHRPPFEILVRLVGAADAAALTTTLRSVAAQAYDDWRVRILCEQPDAADMVGAVIDTIGPPLSWRASALTPSDIGWTQPLIRAEDAFHLILRPGDELGVDALAELAIGSGLHPEADLIYADENRISPISREREAFLKPDYSPDLLWSTNYIGRPWVALGRLLVGTGLTAASLTEWGEYDLVLQCAERAGLVHHVPKLLCHRGEEDPDDDTRSAAALARSAERRGFTAEVLTTQVPHSWRLRRTTPVAGKVSIIIPTCGAHGHIETCITTLREKTAWPDYEIIIIDNIPDADTAWKIFVAENADTVVDIPDAFNWSRFNNRAEAVAKGEFLLFLNDDVEIEQSDWLHVLVENASRPEVGVVGARLLYPNRTVQHAGMFLATNGIARHVFRFAAEDDPGYFGLSLTQRNVMAVTGACLMVRRDVFHALGRFDEAHEVVNNDLDFCLRVHRAGLLTVYTPHATLIHHELASRDRLKDVYDTRHFKSSWAEQFALGDPYFNPRLYRHADDQRPDDEPVEIVYAGQPQFTPDEIRRLLVIKLDHIGDFITALPSIRRLKELFPRARITVLSAPSTQSFAAFEPAIDEFIPFEFFHVKSGLGRMEVTEDTLAALGEQLRALRFDLAIDLRKHPDTRDVLKHSGARYLAGFDHQGQFNYLDIALEWETDRSLHYKRSHVSVDLLNLVEAVGQASQTRQPRLAVSAAAAAETLARLPEDARALFDKPVAAIHPGVGSIMRQWPASHFATLIDLLVSRQGLNIVLIGNPDEAALTQEVLDLVAAKSSVVSLAGKTPLRDLPALLANTVLYVGNNSGPKHIAAAVGVPSIGIHSGVVDATEWGPVGPVAIAIRRKMACSPCYLARVEDCPRSVACLNELDPAQVFEAAVAMLGKPLRRDPIQKLIFADSMQSAAPAANQAKRKATKARLHKDQEQTAVAAPAPKTRQRGLAKASS